MPFVSYNPPPPTHLETQANESGKICSLTLSEFSMCSHLTNEFHYRINSEYSVVNFQSVPLSLHFELCVMYSKEVSIN